MTDPNPTQEARDLARELVRVLVARIPPLDETGEDEWRKLLDIGTQVEAGSTQEILGDLLRATGPMGPPFELPRSSALLALAFIASTAMFEIAQLTDEQNVGAVADRLLVPGDDY
jgi:hypothetical protein